MNEIQDIINEFIKENPGYKIEGHHDPYNELFTFRMTKREARFDQCVPSNAIFSCDAVRNVLKIGKEAIEAKISKPNTVLKRSILACLDNLSVLNAGSHDAYLALAAEMHNSSWIDFMNKWDPIKEEKK